MIGAVLPGAQGCARGTRALCTFSTDLDDFVAGGRARGAQRRVGGDSGLCARRPSADQRAGRSRARLFALRSCPGGFEKIRYRLDPLGPIIDADKGLLQIDQGPGTASGIAVRIKGRGTEAKFGTDQNLSSYTGAAGNYSIPFSASYYQTGSITPGTANASLEFTIKYQ